MNGHRRLVMAGAGGSLRDVEVTFAVARPCTVRVAGAGVVAEGEGPTLFVALQEVRRRLEEDGWLLCCQGAGRHVWPSGMSAQMSAGRRAYRLWPDRYSTRDDLVDIFDPADPSEVATVDEQQAAVEQVRDQATRAVRRDERETGA